MIYNISNYINKFIKPIGTPGNQNDPKENLLRGKKYFIIGVIFSEVNPPPTSIHNGYAQCSEDTSVSQGVRHVSNTR